MWCSECHSRRASSPSSRVRPIPKCRRKVNNVAGTNCQSLARILCDPGQRSWAGIPTFRCDFCWDWYPAQSKRFPWLRHAVLGNTHISEAIKDVRASQEALVDLFGRIEYFFKRLEVYIEVQPTAAMTDIIVKIMVEVLSILGIITKEVKQG
ncbi:hypothetical protein H4582DRAFT_2131021, partial [Lactarius indigo]